MTLIQTQSLTLDRTQLVQLLGFSESAFDRARAKLEQNNFPRKLPGMQKWSRPAVIAWIKANGDSDLMHQILIGDQSGNFDQEIETPDLPAELLARYGGAA